MRSFGLIGKDLTHSFSKKYFTEKFKKRKLIDYQYLNFDMKHLSMKAIKKIIKKYNIEGLNVTSPYKEKIIPYIDTLTEEAKNINSVNTIKIIKNKLIGYNTDIIGFQKSFLPLTDKKKNILILGNGGVSKTIQFILRRENYNYKIVSRNSNFNYQKITKEIIKTHHIIINTTTLGMYPKIKTYPKLPYNELNSKHSLFDLVYNPEETLFLRFGRLNNTKTKNGIEMLELQAEESWKIWNI